MPATTTHSFIGRRIARLVSFCAHHAILVATIGVLLGMGVTIYTVRHFAITTDTNDLISSHLPWRQREIAYNADFGIGTDDIVAVVDGKTPELAEQAAAALAAKLESQPKLFRSVERPDGGAFWAHNGLLYLSTPEVKTSIDQLIAAQPFLGPLAADPSLRGLMGSLSTALTGVNTGQAKLADIRRPIHALADALDGLEAGKPTFFSWRNTISGKPPTPSELRHIILISANLDYRKLEAGRAATVAIRDDARAMNLDAAHGVSVRLTGDAPLQDEEFGTLTENVGWIAGGAVTAILVMLWFAVKSVRVISCILATTAIGLVSAAALGLLVYGKFNVISVAFIPLFVGLGIDFGIQFSVRFRAEHVVDRPIEDALVAAGQGMGRSLTLAATAIACGFLAFTPTDYHALSQLGMVAGMGMFVALLLNLTLLPALLRLSQPPGRKEDLGYSRLAQLDDFLLKNRWVVVGVGVAAALVGAALMPLLHFDFNPIHLRSAKVESVAALLDLMKEPDTTPNTLEVLRPTLGDADQLAARLARLPEVHQTRTLSSFVPADQPAKMAIIGDAALLMDISLDPFLIQPPPTDAEVVQGLTQTATGLRTAAAGASGADARDALRLAHALDVLAKGPPSLRAKASDMLIPGLNVVLDQLRNSLHPDGVTLQSLPQDLVHHWIGRDGRARVSVLPSGDSNDNRVLNRFIDAVVKYAPDATGSAIGIREGGDTVVHAFMEAGLLSFVTITLLLFAVLRRVRDVAITMAPIILTGLLTLGSCVVLGLPLNFANIIALPLLFGIGVAFHIYFVMAWRHGGSHLLLSSLTRAVFFSALTTATGFGSLWASSHPGTASMGKLLMISLIWTLVSALLFQPALMGPPPQVVDPHE